MDPSQSIWQALSAISPSDRTDRTVTVDGAGVQMRYAPEPGVDMRVEVADSKDSDAVTVATTFGAGADRPASYPPELPYLPEHRALVTGGQKGGWTAVWFVASGVERVAAEILSQSAAAGWSDAASSEGGMLVPGMRIVELTRPGLRRTVMISSFGENGSITLSDEPEGE